MHAARITEELAPLIHRTSRTWALDTTDAAF
jgi:hypothetical protein